MRGGRPLPVLLAAASMAVAGMGVRLGGATVLVDEDLPRRRRMVRENARVYGSATGRRPHEHKREIARRLRQQARIAERQAERLDASIYGKAMRNNGVVGLTRRGRQVKVPA